MLIISRGFTNDLHPGLGTEEFKQFGMAFGIIGQVMEAAIEVKLQRKLGNIQAGIDDSSVVLTHTCKDTSPGDWMSLCSSNGSSLGQWARAKPARRRITFKRMPREDVSARTAVPPACRPGDNPSLACVHTLAKSDK